MKICSKCKIAKHESEFRAKKNKSGSIGLRSQCRACDKSYKYSERGVLADKLYNQSEKCRNTAQARQRRYCQTLDGRLKKQQHCRRRREQKRKIDLQLSVDDITAIYAKFNARCFNCSRQDRLEIDHHYPLSKGYGLAINNAVILCKSCNTSKRNKMPEEFYTEKQLLILNDLLGLTSNADRV